MSTQRFNQILDELKLLHSDKQSDYGKEEDPFANLRSANEWGVKPWILAMARANDKVSRLQQFARSGSLKNESAKDSFKDLAVYAIIGLILLEDEENLLVYTNHDIDPGFDIKVGDDPF